MRPSSEPINRLFGVLSHPHRRRILRTIAEANPRQIDEFTPEEFGADGRDLDRFRLELYHVHLPKLADAGYIDWDRSAGTVCRGPNYEEIEPTLDLLLDHEEDLPGSWS
jgi:predicted transcriptional regulator